MYLLGDKNKLTYSTIKNKLNVLIKRRLWLGGGKSETDGEPILLPGVDEKLALVFSTNGNKVKKT